MRQILFLSLIAILLTSSLGLGYLYLDEANKLSDLMTLTQNQQIRINELESTLSASRESWELVNITKSFGIGYDRAHISLVGTFRSLFTRIMVNETTTISGYIHQSEHAYIYSPRDNMTLRVTANLYESTRNVSIFIFDKPYDIGNYSKSPLASFEAKPDVFNEFYVVLPEMGWYKVFSSGTDNYLESYDSFISVEMLLYDGNNFIPFVIRTWELY
jgi:hypothetical protein